MLVGFKGISDNVFFLLSSKVENGTCKATLVDSLTAKYRVADDYCGLDILYETFNDEHCEFTRGVISGLRQRWTNSRLETWVILS